MIYAAKMYSKLMKTLRQMVVVVVVRGASKDLQKFCLKTFFF